jgi:tRNA 2-selenouridine synthase SelU
MIDLDKLKKKESILAKIADLLTINLIWDSNKGMVDKHKKDIKALLKQYYDIIQENDI